MTERRQRCGLPTVTEEAPPDHLSGMNVSSVTLLERVAPGNVIRRCEGKALADVLIQSVSAQQSNSAACLLSLTLLLHTDQRAIDFFYSEASGILSGKKLQNLKTCLCRLAY